MAVAEGKTFNFEDENSIRDNFLETIDYDGNPQEITYETDEFSAVCPFSGLPDIGRVVMVYVPDRKLVELKSLKYYFVSFRNVGIYQEAATNRIYNDLYRCLKPKYLMVKTVYNVRGGIVSTCVMDSEKMKR
ncbi:MAG TPA: preQ(1) synthase [Spirochaetota bacterium]|nr:preQ(1) synthase [Spirochaetota bacterium]HPC42832.1 preQ(1) synthase [Spirochaetota bacterium]HPL17754.1 preQ(1) synthase [Spirochaetota bacterium]HQF10279.1 preQ(1) synthase [Spirochaetota bacterium]HQH99157.1 preQ(1) synthase [Spirochaetota bacterium]